MNFFDLLIDSTAQPHTVTSGAEQPSDVSPISGLHQAVTPTFGLNYLSVAAILLVLAGMIGVTALKLKFKKSFQRSAKAASNRVPLQAQIEMLERIWKLSPQNVED